MNEQQGTENAYENSAYDMIGSSMLVVSEEDAVKFLGRNGLLQLMVDGINGVSSRRYYFACDLLYWNRMHWSTNRP